jgi:hypothetical protein
MASRLPAVTDPEFIAFVSKLEADPATVGVLLSGSRGLDAFVHDGSDWDVRLIVRDDAFESAAGRLGTPHGSRIGVFVLSLETFRHAGDIGGTSEWDRYSYVHAQVLVDKLDGEIARLTAAKAVLQPAEARDLAAEALDDYVNSYYRSLKNDAAGLDVAAQLDAAESVRPLLTALFAIERRVRPFHKFLAWELDRFPLEGAGWAAPALLPRLTAIVTSASVLEQAALFRLVEGRAREHGLGGVIDGWEPDVAKLRSGTWP